MREAIIHLSDGQLAAVGLDGIVELVRDAGLRDLTELVCQGSGGIHQVRVDEPIPGAELDRIDAVVWWERLATSSAGTTYLWKIDPPDHPQGCTLDEHSTAHEVSEVRDDGFELSVIGSQDEISESVAAVDEAGMTALLERLSDYHGSAAPMDALTDRQREIVRTAHAMGYYDVPRTATTGAVADEVGLDASTVAEHLQRAERNLMEQLLARRA